MNNQITITAVVRNPIGGKGFGILDAGAMRGILLQGTVLADSGFAGVTLVPGDQLKIEFGPGREDGSFRFVCTKVHTVRGEKPAPKPASPSKATPTATGQTETPTAPDIEFDAGEDDEALKARRRAAAALQVGHEMVGTWKAGFNERMPNCGFFSTGNGGKDVYVRESDLPVSVLGQLKRGERYRIRLTRVAGPRDRNHDGEVVGVYRSVDLDAVQARLQAELAAREERAAEKAQKRAEKVRAIIGRGKVTIETETGVRLSGYQVSGDEWHALPDGTRCVLFADASFSEPSAFFTVGKTGGTPRMREEQRGITLLSSVKEAEAQSRHRRGHAIGQAIFALPKHGNVPVSVYRPEDLRVFLGRKRTVAHYVATTADGGKTYLVGVLAPGQQKVTRLGLGLTPLATIDGDLDQVAA